MSEIILSWLLHTLWIFNIFLRFLNIKIGLLRKIKFISVLFILLYNLLIQFFHLISSLGNNILKVYLSPIHSLILNILYNGTVGSIRLFLSIATTEDSLLLGLNAVFIEKLNIGYIILFVRWVESSILFFKNSFRQHIEHIVWNLFPQRPI